MRVYLSISLLKAVKEARRCSMSAKQRLFQKGRMSLILRFHENIIHKHITRCWFNKELLGLAARSEAVFPTYGFVESGILNAGRLTLSFKLLLIFLPLTSSRGRKIRLGT